MSEAFSRHLFFEFETSNLSGLRCKKRDGTNYSCLTIKLFNAAGAEITEQSVANTDCVVTRIIYDQDFDHQVDGGLIDCPTRPTDNLYCYVVGAPDIAEEFGGCLEFLSGFNLKLGPSHLEFRATRPFEVINDAINHSDRMHFEVQHPAGVKCTLMGAIIFGKK